LYPYQSHLYIQQYQVYFHPDGYQDLIYSWGSLALLAATNSYQHCRNMKIGEDDWAAQELVGPVKYNHPTAVDRYPTDRNPLASYLLAYH
jgi:hypothetical protein